MASVRRSKSRCVQRRECRRHVPRHHASSVFSQSDAQKKRAESSLVEQYGDAVAKLKADAPELYDDLVAAQVVQDNQATIWCEEIGIGRMLGKEQPVRASLRHAAGVFTRAAVDGNRLTMAKPSRGSRCPVSPRILAERVLYACTLSNLSPVTASSVGEIKSPTEATLGLRDALTSKVHRDTRVFDLYLRHLKNLVEFDKQDHPARWMRYHLGVHHEGKVGSLTETTNGWATIAATAIASGQFPFAFEPVVY